MAIKVLNAGAKDLSANASYTPVNVPVNGDSLRVLDGEQTVDTGLGALAAVNLVDFYQGPGFRGNFGIPGTPAQFNNITGKFELRGGGGQHYYAPGTVAKSRIYTTGAGKAFFSAGMLSDCVNLGGDIEIGAGCTPTILRAAQGNTIVRAGTAGTDLWVGKGFVDLRRDFASAYLTKAGTLNLLDAAAITTRLLQSAGIVVANSTGAIALLLGLAGLFSTRGARTGVTITNAELYEDFGIDDADGVITYTNPRQLFGYTGA